MTLTTNEQRTNELRTNTMNTTTGTQYIRSNIFARSCNDDYSPAMEELCVKMRLLSLNADPKMEACDAKLEQFFYEEKVDNERDEQNDETFVNNDDTEYSLEVCTFNTRYGTNFSINDLDIFNAYVEHTGLTIEDALKYNQVCHTCGDDLDQLNQWGCEYCDDHCRDEFCEGPGRECFHGYDCLICHGYPKSTCYWAYYGCNRCDAYDGPEEERYPYSCTNCLTQMTDHEGYIVDDELYCNNCAVDLFDKTEHLEAQDQDDDSNDSKKRPRESDGEDEDNESEIKRQRLNEKLQRQMSALTDESCDIWDLALDINNGDNKAALQMIEDQPRLRAHPRIIEYYRAKEEDMDFEECSSECSSEDDNLQQRKRARHIRFESVDLDVSEAEDEADAEDEDNDEDDYNYDYAESVVDDDGEVDDEDAEPNNMQMVATIQELQAENAALREELELVRNQRCMLFPEGSSMSIIYEDGQRYINVHSQAQAQARGLTMDDLECGYSGGGGAMEIDEEPLRITRSTADSLPNMHNNMYGSYDDLQGTDIYLGGCPYNNRTTRR